MIPVEIIEKIWENFVFAETGSATRSTWLDVFLATVMSEKSEGKDAKEIISFCLPGDVFTLISCELFADVHRICSFTGDGEDLIPLQNYLLKERGWRSLVVLDDLGTKGLSCSEELANLLISLYPVCLRYVGSSSKKNPLVSCKRLENPFKDSSQKFKSKEKFRCIYSNGKHEDVLKQSTGESPIESSPSKYSASSESEPLEGELPNSKSNFLKVRLDPMDFNYFTSVVRSEDEIEIEKSNSESKQLKSELDYKREKFPDDYINDKIKEILESEVSVFEFCQLSMKLLSTLCDGDDSKERINGKIAIQIVGFVLENLSCLHYGSVVSASTHLLKDDVDELKLEMSWLLYFSLRKALKCSKASCSTIELVTFPSILMLLEDFFRKLYSEKFSECEAVEECSDVFNSKETQLYRDYIYSLFNCFFLYFQSALGTHKPDDFNFSPFLDMFFMFEKCQNGSLIELLVVFLSLKSEPEKSETQGLHSSLGFQVLDLVGSLISKVKEVRMEAVMKNESLIDPLYIFSKKRQSRCRVLNFGRGSIFPYLIHHHKINVFGVPGLSKDSKEEVKSCIISILFDKLLDIISCSRISLKVRSYAAHIAMKCGTCCCFPASRILDSVFSALLGETSVSSKMKHFQNVCFLLLEKTLYPQVWGCLLQPVQLSALEKYSCSCAINNSVHSKPSSSSIAGGSISTNSSGLTTPKEIDHFSSELFCQWNKLSFYKELIDSIDVKLSHKTFSHLIRIFSVATPKVLYELLSLVIFPVFTSAKNKYLSDFCSVEKFKTVSCLSVFSCFIAKSPQYVLEVFNSRSGLFHIIDLIFYLEFTQTCCYVLEEIILVVVNESKKDMNISSSSYNPLKSIYSIILLLIAQDSVSERLVNIMITTLEASNCNFCYDKELYHQSKEYLSLGRYYDGIVQKNLDDSFKDTSLKYFSHKLLSKIDEADMDSFEKVFKFSCIFWKSCASVIQKSEHCQEIFSQTIVCKKGLLLLQMLLLNITRCYHIIEYLSSNLCIKMIESLLIIYLKMSTNNLVCKEIGDTALLEKLRSMLLHLPTFPSVRICLLCEVFIQCSTDDSRDRSALFLSRKPELPSVRVNLEENHTEEMEVALDDDEDDVGSFNHSNACVTADEGYDADVEIIEMDEPCLNHKSKVYNCSDSFMTSLPNSQWGKIVNQTSPAKKWTMQNIIFPDLCCLALDLLDHVHKPDKMHLPGTAILHFDKRISIEVGDTAIEVEENYLETIIQCLQRLEVLCRENANNCILLSRRGAIKKLICSFSFFLKKKSPDLTGLQLTVLDLFTHLAQYTFTAEELSLYLEFFKEKDPPVNSLITPLCQLMMRTELQPHFILCFPLEIGKKSRQDTTKNEIFINQKKYKTFNLFQNKENFSNFSNIETTAITVIQKLHDEHIAAGIQSAWTMSALALPIDADIGWSPWTNGFSLSLWMCLGSKDTSYSNPCISTSNTYHGISPTASSGLLSDWCLSSEQIEQNSPGLSPNILDNNISTRSSVVSNNSLHLFSIGNELLSLETWIDPRMGSLTLKLIRADGEKVDILCESTVETCLSPNVWHHLALNVKDFMQKRKCVLEVTLFIDGFKEIKVLMAFNGLLMRRSTYTCILLGHSQSPYCVNSWYFGNLILLRSPVFSKERAYYLMSMGPNFNHLTECDVEKQHPNFTSILSSSAIIAGLDWDALFEVNNGNLKVLQDNLLLSYCAQNSKYTNVYPAVVTTSGGAGVVGSLFPGQPGFRVVTVDQRASQQLPLGLQPVFLGGSLNLQMYQGLAAAVSSLGGTMVFMFLFAQIVQMDSTEECQARALLCLLKFVHSDGDLFSQFVNEDSYKLLIKVLNSSKCKSGLLMLKAIIDSACDKPVLQYQNLLGKFEIVSQSDAIITQPSLILMIIQAWRGWDSIELKSKASSDFTENCAKGGNSSCKMENLSVDVNDGTFSKYFSVLLTLLRDDHPYREFNAAQLHRVGIVEALLSFCKEQFILEDSASILHSSVYCSLVDVIRLLMGAPPEFSHIVALSDFLVLVHQASATFITHARSSFYFLLSPHSYDSFSMKTMPMSSVKTGLQKLNIETNLSQSLFSTNSGKEAIIMQSIDPRKLNKALSNLQVKQGIEEIENNGKKISVSIQPFQKVQDTLCTKSSFVAHNDKEIYGDLQKCDVCVGNSESDDNTITIDGKYMSRNENGKTGEIEEYSDDFSKLSDPTALFDESSSICNTKLDWNYEELRWGKNVLSSQENEQDEISLNKNPLNYLVGSVSDMSVITEKLYLDGCNISTTESSRVVPAWSKMESPSKSIVLEGLLLLLRDTILVLPDSMSHQVLNYILKAEVLLVMANHYDPGIRTAVVKLIAAYLQRAGDENIDKFLKIHGFYLLANQLGQYSASTELLEACISLITQCSTTLEDRVEISWKTSLLGMPLENDRLHTAAFPLLLALLPKSISDNSMAHKLILFLQNMYFKGPRVAKFLCECGLLEAFIKTLVAQAHQCILLEMSMEKIKLDAILTDICFFLESVVSQSVLMAGAHQMQIINDIQHMLKFMESLEKASCIYEPICVQIIRDMEVSVLFAAVETIYSKIASSYLPLKLVSQKKRYTSSMLQSVSPVDHVSSSITEKTKDISWSEINERFKILLQKSVEFLVNIELNGGSYKISECEMNFSNFILSITIHSLATVLEKSSKGRIFGEYSRRHVNQHNFGDGSLWNMFAGATRDSMRVLAGSLVVHMLCPWQPICQRTFVARILSEESNCKEILSLIFQSHPQIEYKFAVFYQDLLNKSFSSSEGNLCEDFAGRMKSWGLFTSFYNLDKTHHVTSAGHPMGPEDPLWLEEISLLKEEQEKQRKAWERQNQNSQLRTIYKHEVLAKSITDSALDVTRAVVDIQNLERKTFMEHVKLMYSSEVYVKIRWQKLIQQFTHERAVWFCQDSYPRSWELDLTEGPIRIRKRLQRCHLGIDKKFLMENHNKPESIKIPLSYLFNQESSCWSQISSTASVLIEKLLTDEKIRHTCQACIVSPAVEVPGEILIGEFSLYFVADNSNAQKFIWNWENGFYVPDGYSIVWPLEDVVGLYNRRFQLQERALEIFLVNGKTYLLAFHSAQERDAFVAELSNCELPNQLPSDNLSNIIQMWREGLITNFEYLTQLNKMAGRSFNDLMQYPVFPFILSDYTSQTLDITDSRVFRNLKKPMAVQEKKNEHHYIRNYNYLKEELQDVFNSISLNQEPYHYGSHYSNSGTVLHFLVRLPPFTQMFLSYQDHNFDIPDRTFHSLQTTWRLTSTDSTTDVKELIPEFFFLPDFLLNSEGFDFGVRQSGERVHNVHLPPWCEGDARKFILIHRQALESDYVRENIHHWIDLVFGYKQTGKAAVDAINVFHPATYYGFDVESIKDPLERTAWETMIKTYGQTPRQLFTSAHPMVIQSLLPGLTSVSVPSVLPYIRGLQWGSYVGSPADPLPRVVWHHKHHTLVATLVPLLTNDVFGLAPSTSMLLSYGKSKSTNVLCNINVLGAALITWTHSDGIVRIKLRKEQPPWPIIRSSNLDPIWICESLPDCSQLWVGHASGKLVVYKYNFSPMKGELEFKRSPVTLLGHRGGILNICLCRAFRIAVSGSQDGTAIIWDLNNLTYVRSTPDVGAPVQLVCVSDTLGDFVTVSDEIDTTTSFSSCIRLYTINAHLIGSVTVGSGPMKVTSICISKAAEGISVNAIVAGLANGSVRFWSTWDLALIREITCDILTKPIISVAYSHDSQHLYASSSDGIVVIWEGAGCKGMNKTPKFLNLTSL